MKLFTENIKAILAVLVVGAGIGYFFMCSIRGIKADPQILIAMAGSITMVLSYYFGSSSKSNDKPAATTQSGDINVDQNK